MSAIIATLAGVTLTGATQPYPVPVPIGDGPSIEQHITRESATGGPQRVLVPRRYNESWDDITIEFTLTNDADKTTIENSYRNRHQTVTYVYGGTYTCLWQQGGLEITRFTFSLTHYKCIARLHVISS